MKIELRRITLPEIDAPAEMPRIAAGEYESRARELYEAVKMDWIVVYGDREHNANLLYLAGFDPRFEEALLLLGPEERRVLVVGNEGLGYAELTGLPVEVALAQSLSLMGQPRDRAPRLDDVLRDTGIAAGQRVGVAGWKYLEPEETNEPAAPAFVPSFLIDVLRRLTGGDIADVTLNLMHPTTGLRSRNSAAQIAVFEWGAVRASAAVLRIVRGVEPGMTEYQAAGLMGYQGEPASMHPIVVAGARGEPINGLRSPSARRIGKGDGASVAVGYWGSLACRAGLVADAPDDAFFADYVRPYFAAIVTWYRTLSIGVAGGTVHGAVLAALEEGGASFRPLLNPGHLISYEEWFHSPIRPGSADRLASGMLLQCDIIPTPLPAGTVLNCEDTVALADETLRAELARDHPELWQRIERRRAFMREALGLRLAPEVLPLSVANAYLPPFWLDDELVCAVAD